MRESFFSKSRAQLQVGVRSFFSTLLHFLCFIVFFPFFVFSRTPQSQFQRPTDPESWMIYKESIKDYWSPTIRQRQESHPYASVFVRDRRFGWRFSQEILEEDDVWTVLVATKMAAMEENGNIVKSREMNAVCVIPCRVVQSTCSYVMMAL